ncbi:winged helix-turn-helix transcriptional regulator [Cohnella herbarum]|uniref:Helix-turn-helix transcriptional regulator n=1 Tax=Cohnella herbarum TaxID=2728023 RepID=A0A7Z2ZJJ7_9BACL|nr:winged helix-turn-helix transcriptional regulator [Cohnella herbarum]QJD81860.1 helix-turn-helix transcriptional regulator [Cohnella herbarum]
MNKEALVIQAAQKLSGRWTIPILLELESNGGRFTPLQRQLDIAPARLSDNLKQLVQLGVIQHLSPYERRHPLLPEYKLTEEGKHWREMAKAIQLAETNIAHGSLSAKAWNIPVLLTLGFEHEHFQEIRRVLDQVTPRMLSMRLDELNAEGLIRKMVSEQPRPSFLYQLSSHARNPVHRLSVDLSSLI